MKNLKNIEKLMLFSTRQANPDYEKAFNKMVEAVAFLDELDNFGRMKLINVLYNFKKRKYTYERIAADFNVSDNALRRHRIYFAKCFYHYLKISTREHQLAV